MLKNTNNIMYLQGESKNTGFVWEESGFINSGKHWNYFGFFLRTKRPAKSYTYESCMCGRLDKYWILFRNFTSHGNLWFFPPFQLFDEIRYRL